MNEPATQRDRWLRSAREDVAYALVAAAAGHHAPACFHAQQAAEKAVKALHYGRGARVVIGHNVRALIESLNPSVAALTARLDDARDLDVFYIPTRYPNGLESGTPGEAFGPQQSARALAAADAIIAASDANT
ncbi:MAG TPA: HEPN domain-containing protein [Polyangiaceae bacterium]|jgi:HEPN domain-containing protein|nr:HEPN domain-containing protein [Polyangiaceae bacterium]